ncbi:MAG: FAD-dependent tricarballylate dehydrogenase TcuA [archaeon]|nr:FAD-dependent tricarballylate dehydrogenase TcuA [archaeon]
MASSFPRLDLIVVGGGNAGLCAAMSAADTGKSVLLLERAPEEWRGGNSKYTRDIRCCQEPDEFATGRYGEEEFLDDLLRVTHKETNLELANLTVHESNTIPSWMEKHGVTWQKPLKGTLGLSRTNRFFMGGGKALVNTYYQHCKKSGVNILYNARVEDIAIGDDGSFKNIVVNNGASSRLEYSSNSLIVAAGGFEANIEWHKKYWNGAADNFIIRGSKFNDGLVLKTLVNLGVRAVGNPKQFHAIGVDARSPKFEGGIITRIDSIPFSIVVNKFGKRFYDEGEDLWPKRYAIWGKLIAEQPNQIAYSVFDSKTLENFLPTMYAPNKADSISGLAGLIGLESSSLEETVKNYNNHIDGVGRFNPSVLDDCKTIGLDPPKSHWALKIDSPPFYAYTLRPGITFTYLGVAVDSSARILMSDGKPINNMYAAGEIMAGNILTQGYLAGFGLTIGTVFGRIAGERAASKQS